MNLKKLNESFGKAYALQEKDLSPRAKKLIKDRYKSVSAHNDRWDKTYKEQSDLVDTMAKDFGKDTSDPAYISLRDRIVTDTTNRQNGYRRDFTASDILNDKSIESEDYPYYVTKYKEYPKYIPAEGGYYTSGNDIVSSKGFKDKQSAMAYLKDTAEDDYEVDYRGDELRYEPFMNGKGYTTHSKYIGDNGSYALEKRKNQGSGAHNAPEYESFRRINEEPEIKTFRNKRNPNKFMQTKHYPEDGHYYQRQFMKYDNDDSDKMIVNDYGSKSNKGRFHRADKNSRNVWADDYDEVELLNDFGVEESFRKTENLHEACERILHRMNESPMSAEDKHDSDIIRGIMMKQRKEYGGRVNARLTQEEKDVLAKYGLDGYGGTSNLDLTYRDKTNKHSINSYGRRLGYAALDPTNDKINFADKARKDAERSSYRQYLDRWGADTPDATYDYDHAIPLQPGETRFGRGRASRPFKGNNTTLQKDRNAVNRDSYAQVARMKDALRDRNRYKKQADEYANGTSYEDRAIEKKRAELERAIKDRDVFASNTAYAYNKSVGRVNDILASHRKPTTESFRVRRINEGSEIKTFRCSFDFTWEDDYDVQEIESAVARAFKSAGVELLAIDFYSVDYSQYPEYADCNVSQCATDFEWEDDYNPDAIRDAIETEMALIGYPVVGVDF